MYFGSHTIEIGDFYCTYSNGQPIIVKANNISNAVNKGIIPAALIFSTTTESVDAARGWNTGYAISLKSEKLIYSTNEIIEQSQQYPPIDQNSYIPAIKDMKGYEETYKILNKSSYNDNSYPAFSYTKRYSPQLSKGSSSGWFIPSLGHLNIMLHNLSPYSNAIFDSADIGYFGPYNQVFWERINGIGKNNANHFLNNINNYLIKAGSANYNNIIMTIYEDHKQWGILSVTEASNNAYVGIGTTGLAFMGFYMRTAKLQDGAKYETRLIVAF